MNSVDLRLAYLKLYEELFSQCFVVCSAPLSFYWCGDVASYMGVPALVQGLPVRLYVGLSEPIDGTKGRIALEPQRYFVPSAHLASVEQREKAPQDALSSFRSRPLPDSYEMALRVLYSLYSDELKRWPSGLSVKVISELPPHSGLNAESAFSVGLSAAFLLAIGQLNQEDLCKGKCAVQAGTLSEGSGPDKVFRLASALEAAIMRGRSSGAGPMAAIVPSYHALIYMLESASTGWTETANVYRDNFDAVQKRKYWTCPIDLISDDPSNLSCPVAFGLIWSGCRSQASSDSLLLADVFDHTVPDAVKGMTQTLVDRLPDDSAKVLLPNELVDDPAGFANSSFRNLLFETSLECMYAFHRLLVEGPLNQWERRLFEAINCQQRLLYMLGLSGLHFDYCAEYIRRFISELSSAGALGLGQAGVKLTGSGSGGDLLFAISNKMLTNSDIEAMVDGLPRLPRRPSSLDYASWRDGMGGGGLAVEQSPKSTIAEATIINPDGAVVRRYLRSFDAVQSLEKRADVFLDKLHDVISVKHKRLRSEGSGRIRTPQKILNGTAFLVKAASSTDDPSRSADELYAATGVKGGISGSRRYPEEAAERATHDGVAELGVDVDRLNDFDKDYVSPLNAWVKKVLEVDGELIDHNGRNESMSRRYFINKGLELTIVLVEPIPT